MNGVLVKSAYNPRVYEVRNLHHEAIANRIIREFEMQSIYQGESQAAVEIMNKYDGNRDEMAWVLMGGDDIITKSHEVYDYIDSILKGAREDALADQQAGITPQAPASGPISPTVGGAGTYGMTGPAGPGGGKTAEMKTFGDQMGFGAGFEGLGGKAKGPESAGSQETHPAGTTPQQQAQQAPQGQKPGLASRFGTWAKERAAPAMGRGLRHLGATVAGGAMGGPAGALAGLGGSLYQSHKGKQSGQYGKVMGGEGGLGGIAGDAAKQGGAAAGQAAQQFGTNVQQGGGVGGFLGQAGRAAGNLASSAGSAIAAPFKGAWQQAGQQQAANAAAAGNAPAGGQQPPQANAAANPSPPMQQPPAGGTPPPAGGTPPPAGGTPPPAAGGTAQVDPSAVQQIAGGQQQQQPAGPPAPAGPGLASQTMSNQAGTAAANVRDPMNIQVSYDDPKTAYTSIEAILKGW